MGARPAPAARLLADGVVVPEPMASRQQDLLLIRPMRAVVEHGLMDEAHEASWRAHMFLSLLGLSR